MTTTTLATRPTNGNGALTAADYWNDEQKRAIRDMLVPPDKNGKPIAVSDAQLALFADVCRITNLDPWTRQIWLLPLDGGPQPYIGINGLRAIAARVPEGISSQVFWKSRGGDWEESWDEEGAPFAAMAVIKRGASIHRAVVHLSEFPALHKNAARPAHWIGTVAERHGLRKACPLELAQVWQAVATTGAVMQDSDDEPELPATAAPRQIAAPAAARPAPTNGTSNGNASLTRDDLVKRWNEWTARAVLAGVEWEDLIPDFALEKVTEAELRDEGPKLVKRVKAAEAKAAEAPTQPAEEDAPIEAELRESPEAAEPTDEPVAAVEFAEPPTLDAIKAEFDAMSKEAVALNVPHRVPGAKAGAKDYADAIASLEPKLEAARGRPAK